VENGDEEWWVDWLQNTIHRILAPHAQPLISETHTTRLYTASIRRLRRRRANIEVWAEKGRARVRVWGETKIFRECCHREGYRAVYSVCGRRPLPWFPTPKMESKFSFETFVHTLKMESKCAFETSVHIRTTWRYISENNNIHNCRYEKHKYHIFRNSTQSVQASTVKSFQAAIEVCSQHFPIQQSLVTQSFGVILVSITTAS
jgi:hypothetical protein